MAKKPAVKRPAVKPAPLTGPAAVKERSSICTGHSPNQNQERGNDAVGLAVQHWPADAAGWKS